MKKKTSITQAVSIKEITLHNGYFFFDPQPIICMQKCPNFGVLTIASFLQLLSFKRMKWQPF